MDPTDELRQVLDRRNEAIRPSLQRAREELAILESRASELRRLIARAEGVPSADLTLHEAMARVLASVERNELTAKELAEAVDRRGLYKKRDGTAVDAAQIHARARNYDNLFEKTPHGIGIRHKYTVADLASRGSYEAKRVTVMDRRSGDHMTVDVRVSYTALAVERGIDLAEIAVQKARDSVARSGFTAGDQVKLLLTSQGWVESEGWESDG